MGVQEFEQEVKADIAQHKLLSVSARAVIVSDKDIAQEVKRQDTKVKFEYAVLSLDDVKKQIKPTDAELKAFYDQNKQKYANSIPEKIKAKYILIDTKKLADKVQITPEEMQQYYTAASGRVPHSRDGHGSPHSDQDADAGCERQSGPERCDAARSQG